jgi:hypothetical protein
MDNSNIILSRKALKGGNFIMNNKGQAATWIFLVVFILAVLGAGVYLFGGFGKEGQTVIQQQTAQQAAQATKSGDISTIGVYVNDISNNDISTKTAVPVYCMGDDNVFIIDNTASSKTAEITGKTTYGKTVTCWAFNTSVQTKDPITITVDEEYEHVIIESYKVPVNAQILFYTDTLANNGVNVTGVGASGTGTFNKMRFKNNETDVILPVAGFYLDTVTGSNISSIDMVGSATVSGVSGKPSVEVVRSSLSTNVNSRKGIFDQVFEISDGVDEDGRHLPLLLEENDYLETGSVSVLATSNGCIGTGTNALDLVTPYAFTKGYYRSAIGSSIKYGHETDAQSPAVITPDITQANGKFYCTA